MGGEQAAHVLATVQGDAMESRGQSWPEAQRGAFMDDIRAQYEHQGHPYYASARIWDDGVIDPGDTRRVLGMTLTLANREANVEQGAEFGIFRM